MTEFTLSAPLANADGFEPCGFYSQLALALGRMTGAMLSDGCVLDIGNDSLSNVSMQAMVVEGGLDLLVMGSAPSIDECSTFVAMSDGSIWRLKSTCEQGSLVTKFHKTTTAEFSSDCQASGECVGGIKQIVGDALRSFEYAGPEDQINGHIKLNAHAAICRRVSGSGRFVVSSGNIVKAGYAFIVDATRPDAELEEVLATLRLAEMSSEEIQAEQDMQKKALGIASPFPVTVGEA